MSPLAECETATVLSVIAMMVLQPRLTSRELIGRHRTATLTLRSILLPWMCSSVLIICYASRRLCLPPSSRHTGALGKFDLPQSKFHWYHYFRSFLLLNQGNYTPEITLWPGNTVKKQEITSKWRRSFHTPAVRTALTQSLETGTNARASVGKW